MIKKAESYNLTTGVITFCDGTKKKFTEDAKRIIDKSIYIMLSGNNFVKLDLSTELGIEISIDSLHD